MKKEIWRLWVCSTCRSETQLNYVANKESYERIKACHCGSELAYAADLEDGR